MHLRCHNVVTAGARRTGQAAREAHGSWQYQRKVSVRTLARPMGSMVRKSNSVLPRGSNHTFQQAKRMRARKKALQHVLQGLQTLVGAAGFELATLCSQSRCATRLRYAPTSDILTLKQPFLDDVVKKVALDSHSSRLFHMQGRQPERGRCCHPQTACFCSPFGGAAKRQLPRVMGMSTSPGKASCFANSSLAKELRCTSSGPSASRSVRWWA